MVRVLLYCPAEDFSATLAVRGCDRRKASGSYGG